MANEIFIFVVFLYLILIEYLMINSLMRLHYIPSLAGVLRQSTEALYLHHLPPLHVYDSNEDYFRVKQADAVPKLTNRKVLNPNTAKFK